MILQQLQQKNEFLKRAYEEAYKFAPETPFSVTLNPFELGKLVGCSEVDTRRIMTELVAEGLVRSSLGMRMLMVTREGLNYLQQLELQPEKTSLINFHVGDNSSVQFQQGTVNSNQNIMKQSEKLDLILKGLYTYKYDGKIHSIASILNKYGIPTNYDEIFALGKHLERDGYIQFEGRDNDVLAALTTNGINYVEGDSYSYKGQSIVNNNYNVSIVNSPNSNLVSQSSNVSILQEIGNVQKTVNEIRETVQNDKSIDPQLLNEILECLNEIEQNIKNGNKPKFAIKSLLEISGHVSSIVSLLATLGQFAGLVPITQ